MIVGAERERDGVIAAQDVGRLDRGPFTVGALVGERGTLADRAGGRVEHEVAAGGDPDLVLTREAERDLVGVGARGEAEVVLESAAVAVPDDVRARPDGAIGDAANVGIPVCQSARSPTM